MSISERQSTESRSMDVADTDQVRTARTLDARRLSALQEINDAPFTLFHVKVCLVASIGFFTDAYDIFAISIASTMLGYVYGDIDPNRPGRVLSKIQELGIKAATPVGTLVGQLIFGWLADLVGRKRMYGVELMIIITATFSQALAGSGHAINILVVLVIWRFIMGIGIGGDYPLSAVISSEFAATRIRGRMMTAVFAAQGWGNFTASLLSLIIVVAYKRTILNDPGINEPIDVDFLWRILIGLGCVPAVIALYFRLTLPETPRFVMDVERNVQQASRDIMNVLTVGNSAIDPDAPILRANVPKATWDDFSHYFRQWKNGKILLGTCWSWFALDIAFYGMNLNSSHVLQAIGFGDPDSSGTERIYDNLHNICVGNLIISAGGLIPGYYFSFLFIDRWGRKPIQLMGFIMLTILFVVMGFGYDKLTATPAAKKGFVVLYCLANFFQNFGPNTTTFILPGELFPTRYRSTAHGISAASGKLGAVVAQIAFTWLKDINGTDKFIKHILQIFALFMLTGILSTHFLIPETKGLSLEELSGEEQKGFVKGIYGNVTVGAS